MAIQTERSTARFKDFYTDLDVHPVRGDLYVLEDTDAVKVSIKNILFTNPGERFFDSKFGGGIPRTLFDNISYDSEIIIKKQIEFAIRNYEPRVDFLDVVVNALIDENAYAATIIFSLVNNPSTEKFNVILTRVR